jgi:hypothetical protein
MVTAIIRLLAELIDACLIEVLCDENNLRMHGRLVRGVALLVAYCIRESAPSLQHHGPLITVAELP